MDADKDGCNSQWWVDDDEHFDDGMPYRILYGVFREGRLDSKHNTIHSLFNAPPSETWYLVLDADWIPLCNYNKFTTQAFFSLPKVEFPSRQKAIDAYRVVAAMTGNILPEKVEHLKDG